MKYFFFAVGAIMGCIALSCTDNSDIPVQSPVESVITDRTDFTMFRLISDSGCVYTAFLIDDSAIHIKVPHSENLSKLRPEFSHNGLKVLVGGTEIKSGEIFMDFSDFLQPQEFVVESSNADQQRKTVFLYDLPVMIIETPDGSPIVSKTERTENCSISIIDADGICHNLGTAGVRGRGNSSWLQPKKPYNIKLDKKHEILGMNSSKHWILLANAYYDRTQLHNAAAFEMARLTDYPWVPKGTFVELILNGEHQGLYYLCEKIRVEKGKIDIKEINPSDTIGDALTGGYLLESANAPSDMGIFIMTDYINKTGNDYPLLWELKTPDSDDGEVPIQQINYIRETLNRVECLIMDPDSLATGKYRDYFDIESAINWWLIQEATQNEEMSRSKNIYLYKERNGKLVVGPPWDLDAWTFGLIGTRRFFFTRNSFYLSYLVQDPVFLERAREKFSYYKKVWLEHMESYIDEQCDLILRAAERNEKMWPDWHPLNYPNDRTYTDHVKEMWNSLLDQILWMDGKLIEGDFSDGVEN